MKNSAKEGRLNETSIALLTNAGIISSLTAGLQESFWNLPGQPHSIRVVDITKQKRDSSIRIEYIYSLNGTTIPACLPVITII